MFFERMSLPFKAILGLAPIFYAGIIVATLPNTVQSAIIMATVLVTLLMLVGWLGFPLQAIWPIFPGAILILAGTLAVFGGVPTLGLNMSARDGLLILFSIGAGYLFWAARATWKISRVY